ncbi:hypothetical protein PV08_11020 [Exophiala spinifera]|uniref:Xylanolytic transcriptional activator regulatory domain-containing protein n=1 Tax=Exophiala spinifera TaxID=91928 RepID=A0A0D2AYC4_9EURO|nr:uncharacterized protein PV08_11020 [Exophiala spinifera]KIW11718.1 hypothetical protein PV08_11020 [Exophiala spinifera]
MSDVHHLALDVTGVSNYALSINEDEVDIETLDFQTMLFLDPGIFRYGQVQFPWTNIPVPPHITRLLGDNKDLSSAVSRFFDHIHSWMPFISRKRFLDSYMRPSARSRPDVAILLLSLKLITTPPPVDPRNPKTPLYWAAKHFYLDIESSHTASIAVLQAGVLLALYEIRHGIYPAAFLSISACARYAHALGINVDGMARTSSVFTLIEVEERKRIWWAIVILDRFVNIGCPGRPLATAEPTLDDLLPADDVAWDQGIVGIVDSYKVSSPTSSHMSKFALLCQAARLLGQVLRQLSNNTLEDHHDDSWMQLDRTLDSMLAAALHVDSPDYDQITFIYKQVSLPQSRTGLVALNEPYLSLNEGIRSQRAKFVVEAITDTIRTNLLGQQCLIGRDPESVSPWGLFFGYRICVYFVCSEHKDSYDFQIVESLKEVFRNIDVRWNAAGNHLILPISLYVASVLTVVAGVYLRLLEAHEVMSKG